MNPLRVTLHSTPVGEVLIGTDDEGIVALHPIHEPSEAAIARIAARANRPVVVKSATAATIAARQLDEYFSGRRRVFSLPLQWGDVGGFLRNALEAICEIPYGETAGYGEVAAMAGSPRAARAVGTACATTPFSIVVPVHRVVRADGSLGGYGGHPEVKARLLSMEEAVVLSAARPEAE